MRCWRGSMIGISTIFCTRTLRTFGGLGAHCSYIDAHLVLRQAAISLTIRENCLSILATIE